MNAKRFCNYKNVYTNIASNVWTVVNDSPVAEQTSASCERWSEVCDGAAVEKLNRIYAVKIFRGPQSDDQSRPYFRKRKANPVKAIQTDG